jgi:hypothetical protein
MSNMIWIHSLMNQAAMNRRGLHVSAGYVVYLYRVRVHDWPTRFGLAVSSR